MPQKEKFSDRLLRAVKSSLRPGAKTALWVMKLMLPITLGVSILNYIGVVAWISKLVSPLFALMGLSGEAALVFITAALGNLYSGIAVMATIGVDFRSAVILATMGLICHNLIIESAVQKKAWSSPLYIVPLRICVSILSGILLNQILPDNMSGRLFMPPGLDAVTSWGDVFNNWFFTILPLAVRMVVLIISLNIIQGILREFNLLKVIAWPLRPLMKIFGLPESTSFLWIICNVIGITYGGAAVIDEVERGAATPDDARLLNTHVAISHSMLEDTIIYVSIGIPVLLVILPRLILAICAVWIHRFVRAISISKQIA